MCVASNILIKYPPIYSINIQYALNMNMKKMLIEIYN